MLQIFRTLDMLQTFRKCDEFCSAGVLWPPDYSSVSAVHAAQAD